jgi:hypothetical protein
MIDISQEEMLSLTEARSDPLLILFNDGRRPDVGSVWRWCRRGARTAGGKIVKLESRKLALGIRTSREAVKRFVDAVASDAADHPRAPSARSTRRHRTVRDAERICAREGALTRGA